MCKSGTIKEMSIQSSASLLNTMRVINKNTQGICFILEGKKLVGVLTDGDIRRVILKGLDLSEIVSKVMRKNFLRINVGSSISDIQDKLKAYDGELDTRVDIMYEHCIEPCVPWEHFKIGVRKVLELTKNHHGFECVDVADADTDDADTEETVPEETPTDNKNE